MDENRNIRNIQNELESLKNTTTEKALTIGNDEFNKLISDDNEIADSQGEVKQAVNAEIRSRTAEFNKSIDIDFEDVTQTVKNEANKLGSIDANKLKIAAYNKIIKSTKSKLVKKIARELKKELK